MAAPSIRQAKECDIGRVYKLYTLIKVFSVFFCYCKQIDVGALLKAHFKAKARCAGAAVYKDVKHPVSPLR